MSEELIIQKIKAGEEEVLSEVYIEYREEFIRWLIKRFQCDMDTAKEIYQLTIVIFYDNVVTGKLQNLSGSLKTYLFAIGKNKFFEHKRAEGKTRLEDDPFFFDRPILDTNTAISSEQELKLVSEAMQKLGDACKSILEHFYYYNFSMQEITQKLNYKNVNTTKNLKYKCLKRLQTFFKKIKNQNVINE